MKTPIINLFPLTLLLFAICIANVAFTKNQGFAQEWIAPTGGDYSDGSNWSTGSVPGPMSSIRFSNLDATVLFDENLTTAGSMTLATGLPGQQNTVLTLSQSNPNTTSQFQVDTLEITANLGIPFLPTATIVVQGASSSESMILNTNTIQMGSLSSIGSVGSSIITANQIDGGRVFVNGGEVRVSGAVDSRIGVGSGLFFAGSTHGSFSSDQGVININSTMELADYDSNIARSAVETGQLILSDGVNLHLEDSTWDNFAGVNIGDANGQQVQMVNSTFDNQTNVLVQTFIGQASNTTGHLSISQNSDANFTGGIVVGDAGHGTISITGDSRLIAGPMWLAREQGSTAQINLSNNLAQNTGWVVNGTLIVGDRGNATIMAEDSIINSFGAILAREQGSTGAVILNSGGQWLNGGQLIVGGDGTRSGGQGLLELHQGSGLTSFGEVLVARGSRLLLNGGVLTAAGVVSDGEFIFNHGSLSLFDSQNVLSLGGNQVFGQTDSGLTRTLDNLGRTVFDATSDVDIRSAAGFRSFSIVNHGRISISAENADLGNSSRHDGYSGSGDLDIGSNTLQIADAGLAQVGGLVHLDGGNLQAENGLALTAGSAILGNGVVFARIAGGLGSQIIASDGDLTLGEATNFSGFSTGGDIITNQNTVSILDRNRADLGALTLLGDGLGSEGNLEIANGAVVDFGENILGFGKVISDDLQSSSIIMNGYAAGNGVGEELTFSGYVKGVGTFEDVVFTGTFAPGLSPAALSAGNLTFDSSAILEMEVGGLLRGTEFDSLDVDHLTLDGILQLQLFGGFLPTAGDSFDLLDWQSLTGEFAVLDLPELAAGLRWDANDLYTSGTLRVASIPEPSCFVLMAVVSLSFVTSRRRNRVGLV